DLARKVAVVVLAGVDGIETDQCPGVLGVQPVAHDAGQADSVGAGVVGDVDLGALDDLLRHVWRRAALGEIVADRTEPGLPAERSKAGGRGRRGDLGDARLLDGWVNGERLAGEGGADNGKDLRIPSQLVRRRNRLV